METRTIIQQIQPQCDNLYKNIKKAVNEQHKTHRDIVENTGVPRSTIAKFLSGALSNPCVFYIAALCKYLNISMDSLFDMEPPKEPDTGTATELQTKLDSAEQQIAHLKEKCRMLEAGIKERKPVIYGLAGLCIFLAVALCGYIVMDVRDSNNGFFTADNRIGNIWLLTVAAVAVVLTATHFIEKARTKRKHDKEQHNTYD